MPSSHPVRHAGLLLTLGLALASPRSSLAQREERTPVVMTPHFAFYSDFATNLNDALIAAGTARNDERDELFRSAPEDSCFAALPPSARAGWDRAVDYYAEIVAPADWTDRQQYLIRMQLAGLDEELRSARDRQFVEIAGSVRGAAAPAYAACRWPTQDAENRRWVDEELSMLATYEATIARRLTALYHRAWDTVPIPVDVVQIVSWSGANSTITPPHLLISNSYHGFEALEVVFHEASHALMARSDPVRRALDDAARAQRVSLPSDLWHVLLFYTTGEAVRRTLADGGEPAYTPMLYDIFERNEHWRSYQAAIEGAWPAYMDGKRTLAEAAADLIRALGLDGRRP